MEIIHNNPFRIAGVLSNATAKELQKNKTKLSAYLQVGREISFDTDYDILKPVLRDSNIVDEAFSKIQHSKDRVLNALFWFSEGNASDNDAFNHLREGIQDRAFEIWSDVINNMELNVLNFSSFNNIGTLKLLSSDILDIQEGIEYKIKLIESQYFTNFTKLVADDTYNVQRAHQIESFVDEVLKNLNKNYSATATINLFSKCNGSTEEYLLKKLTEAPLFTIETAIESTKKKRKEDKKEGYNLGTNLFHETREDLDILKSVLGEMNLQYKMIADNLAKEILQCGIDFFNSDLKSNEKGVKSLELLNHAYSIAVGEQLRTRISENFEALKDKIVGEYLNPHMEKIKNALQANDSLSFSSLDNLFFQSYLSLVSLKESIPKMIFKNDNYYINNLKIGFQQLVVHMVNDLKKEDSSSQIKFIYSRSIFFLEFLNDKLKSTEENSKRIKDNIAILKPMLSRLTSNDWDLGISGKEKSPYSAKKIKDSQLFLRIKLHELKREEIMSSSQYKTAVTNLENTKKWKLFRNEGKRENDIKSAEKNIGAVLVSLEDINKKEIADIEEWLKKDDEFLNIINLNIY